MASIPLRSGSSPRARGTLYQFQWAIDRPRFIPAGAGNTRGFLGWLRPSPVHPRGRGEHDMPSAEAASDAGSSPRARGTLGDSFDGDGGGRFIPAGAGNTLVSRSERVPRSVHPRGRGEHCSSVARTRSAAGSSPRARGTLLPVCWPAFPARFIPAGAGNTPARAWNSSAPAVHPRGRGEHITGAPGAGKSAGSSPRARGTRCGARGLPVHRRFIPAGAGNTTSPGRWRRRATVHPRGRGEHSMTIMVQALGHGSSPRARGTLSRLGCEFRGVRFIPAGAGNTSDSTLH